MAIILWKWIFFSFAPTKKNTNWLIRMKIELNFQLGRIVNMDTENIPWQGEKMCSMFASILNSTSSAIYEFFNKMDSRYSKCYSLHRYKFNYNVYHWISNVFIGMNNWNYFFFSLFEETTLIFHWIYRNCFQCSLVLQII